MAGSVNGEKTGDGEVVLKDVHQFAADLFYCVEGDDRDANRLGDTADFTCGDNGTSDTI